MSALVLLDLNVAFDTVDHGTLREVLSRRFGITGSVLEWFKSYLTGRTQTVTKSSEPLQRFHLFAVSHKDRWSVHCF